jgi:NitT/TauT family transport system substrate-binding protein
MNAYVGSSESKHVLARGGRPLFLQLAACFAIVAASCLCPGHAAAEIIKVGVVKTSGPTPVFIAQENGYFAAENVPAELVFFDSSQPIAVAVASGAIDFGVTGFTAGFYRLAAQGELKIISGGHTREAPAFHNLGYVISNQAHDRGFTSLKNFVDHSVAISQVGSPPHYALSLLIEKYGLDAKTIRILPVQSISNMVSAVSGGQVDATILPASAALPLIQGGKAAFLAWVGDETPWEFGAAFTATGTTDKRRDTVERFLRAFRHGVKDCHDAFVGADGTPAHAPPPATLATLAKHIGLTLKAIEVALPYCDAEARLDVQDLMHQVAWYESQGMLKAGISIDTIIDKHFVVSLPAP